jgi:uncharacterized protein
MKFNGYKIAITVILLFIVVLIGFILFYNPARNRSAVNPPESQVTAETRPPVFRSDAKLRFLEGKTGKQICQIDVEVADNDATRTQGLMYRESLPEMAGMLFMFEEQQPLAFWMKNTKIPLDIIYADSGYKIVSIHANTKPFSEDQIPSDKPAQYVVELNAGFAERSGIKPGDRITF